MSEIITVSHINDPVRQPIPISRDQYYASIFTDALAGVENKEIITKDVQVAPHILSVILFNQSGHMILQNRASTKKHNAGLMDKTIGGHIQWDYHSDPLWTGILESIQELRIAMLSVPYKDYAEKLLQVGKHALGGFAFTTQIGRPTLMWFRRTVGDRIYLMPNIVHLYLGAYFGGVIPADCEVGGIAFRPASIESLTGDPHTRITDDLFQILSKHAGDIQHFSRLARQLGDT